MNNSKSVSKKNLFDSMIERVKSISSVKLYKDWKSFPMWFIEMYFMNPNDIFCSDGRCDGKIDLFFNTNDGEFVKHFILNSKFTTKYDKIAPVSFYDEIISFVKVFEDKGSRKKYIENYIRKDLRNKYTDIFYQYDNDRAELIFLTNYKKNINQFYRVEKLNLKIFHLEDIIQYMIDDIEGAMPRSSTLYLTGIRNILSPEKSETTIPISIIFAKIIDFIKYMKKDQYDLLFARNIRYDLGNTEPNKSIKDTFKDLPKEFAYSNNGITLLCEEYSHDPGNEELRIKNPRIVNGSQTLHSVRHISNPSSDARLMVRIVQVKPVNPNEISMDSINRKEIINKISIRNNLQNPIKKWNLVANDDFQQSLKRYFRKCGYYYITRKKEWNFRRTELKNVGIQEGPFITKLTQLIASYYYKLKPLGPANAKGNLNKLFDKAYEEISVTDPKIVYQLFLLEKIILKNIHKLSNLKYIRNIKNHCNFTLISLFVRLIKESNDIWGEQKFSDLLENDLNDETQLKIWKNITKELFKYLIGFYTKENEKYKKKEEQDLTYNNYFKTFSYLQPLFVSNFPIKIKKLSKHFII